MIRIVTLDLFHTLVQPMPTREDRLAAVCRDLGMAREPDDFLLASVAADDYFTSENGRWPIHTRSREEQVAFYAGFYGMFLRAVGLMDDPDSRERVRSGMEARRGDWVIHDDAYDAIDALRDRDLALAIISNTPVDARPLCDRVDLTRRVDFIVSSCLVGCEKPCPEIFHAALEEARVPPDEALHVGDQPLSDSVGAVAVGMATLLLDRRGALDHVTKYKRIASLGEIAPWIDAKRQAPLELPAERGTRSIVP
ncbi:MAG: HAD family hydrolase [Chloroflexota bacterium]|nr:MAG: HAD family hydrolase [Chloroflexota bacterium]